MKTGKYFRILTALMAMVLFFTALSPAVNAETVSQESVPEDNLMVENNINTEGDLSLAELADRTLPESDRPEAVSLAEVIEKGHVNRLRAQETDLNTVIFQNRDGTKTMYLFGRPVKYVDRDGAVRDKSSKIIDSAAKGYRWQNAANDILTLFPASLSSSAGIKLEYVGEDRTVGVEMIPVTRGAVVSAGTAEEASVTYSSVFGPFTALRYTPTFNGFKEEIILGKNAGSNTFGFTLKTGGLSLAGDDEQGWTLVDPRTGEAVINIGKILVYDSNNRQTVGSMTAGVVVPEREYALTVSVDVNFLNDPNTAWPVIIDPDLTFSPRDSADNIHDAAIYTNKPNTNISNGYQHIGYVNSNYGTGRVLVKFPNLMNNTVFAGLHASQITAATFRMYREAGFGGPATIGIYSYTGSVWTESTVGYTSAIWNAVGTHVSSAYVTDASYFDFNILTAVKAWKNGTVGFDPLKGLIFKNNSGESSSGYDRSFYATEGAGATLPLLTISYITYFPPAAPNPNIVSGDIYYIENAAAPGIRLTTYNNGTAAGTRIWQMSYSGAASQRFKLEYVSNYGYKIIPQNATDKVLTVNSLNQMVIDSFSSSNLRHYWTIITNSDGSFTITNRATTYVICTPSAAAQTFADTAAGGTYQKWRVYSIELPYLFVSLVNNAADLSKIKYTDDGFYIFVKPLADILGSKGVTYLPASDGRTEGVYAFYDDWYIFAVNNGSSVAYGLAKMREPENDYNEETNASDLDQPGVAISLIGFEHDRLTQCLADSTDTNRGRLWEGIDKAISDETIIGNNLKYNQVILDYFKDPASEGSYLVAEEFVRKMASYNVNGILDAPPGFVLLKNNYIAGFNAYKALILQSGYPATDDEIRQYYFNDINTSYDIKYGYRVYQRALDLNAASGATLYDFSSDKINVGTSSELSLHKRQLLLVTHTANATFNSFAAEVKFHADYAELSYGTLDFFNVYQSAIISEMSIGEGTGVRTEIADEYYDLDSGIVQEQIRYHGEY